MAKFTALVLQAANNTEIYNQSLDINFPEGNTKVDSVTNGRVGTAPGVKSTTISASNARLAADSRFDWQAAWLSEEEIPIRVTQLGDDKVLEGKFVCDSVQLNTSGPGSPTIESLQLSSVGYPAPTFK